MARAGVGRVRPADARVSAASYFARRIGALRAQYALPGLHTNAVLVAKAQRWSAWMAGGGCGRTSTGVAILCHSVLAQGITVTWSRLEENVGVAQPSAAWSQLEAAFERSPEHRANMLNRVINSVGIGVAYANDRIYVAEEFMTTS
jgi:uncharacterized protein YkwD